MPILYKSELTELKLFREGKVREVYEVGDYLLIVSSDRISAFDVIMSEPVPDKGYILSAISEFWFNKTESIIKNHFVTSDIHKYPEICQQYKDQLMHRSMLVKKCDPLPVECIVRGYIAGSGWKEYKATGQISEHVLPKNLVEYSKLPEPIFTPSTKADSGHDENITFDKMCDIIGEDLSYKLREVSLELFKYASNYLSESGLILADTKFEFGIDSKGELILIDEAITPDSSRFWLALDYFPGKEQTNFDKQILRNYLEEINWSKEPPAPNLPKHILELTHEKYKRAYYLITRKKWISEIGE